MPCLPPQSTSARSFLELRKDYKGGNMAGRLDNAGRDHLEQATGNRALFQRRLCGDSRKGASSRPRDGKRRIAGGLHVATLAQCPHKLCQLPLQPEAYAAAL